MGSPVTSFSTVKTEINFFCFVVFKPYLFTQCVYESECGSVKHVEIFQVLMTNLLRLTANLRKH